MTEIKRVLIANRGEIAVRIARTVIDLGLEAVAAYAADDAGSLHVRSAGSTVALPGSGVAAYLDVAAVVAAAVATGCDAVHPGYGFLSEDAGFARAVEAAGLVFVGPTPVQLERLGDKLAARQLAEASGVPVADASALLSEAHELAAFLASLGGDPAMVKAVHGGGGRGMRIVAAGADLEGLFRTAGAEAKAAFGRPALFAERLIENARHIEVQLVGDGNGAVIALGTRDCSLQLRRQKLIEFAPATGLGALASALETAACALGQAIALRGVATVEFLVRDDRFWFLEVNPRLQVEHTVTEAVFGIDLVAIQLTVAAGRSLAEAGLVPAPVPRGVAVQLRIGAAKVHPRRTCRAIDRDRDPADPPRRPGRALRRRGCGGRHGDAGL